MSSLANITQGNIILKHIGNILLMCFLLTFLAQNPVDYLIKSVIVVSILSFLNFILRLMIDDY